MWGWKALEERKRTGWHSIYTTHEYLKSLNKLACVMTRDCTLPAHYSCYCGVREDVATPRVTHTLHLSLASHLLSAYLFCLRHLLFSSSPFYFSDRHRCLAFLPPLCCTEIWNKQRWNAVETKEAKAFLFLCCTPTHAEYSSQRAFMSKL